MLTCNTNYCFNIFPSTPPTGLNENNYDSVGDAKTVSITFIVDDWAEEANGMYKYRDITSGEIDDTLYAFKGGIFEK